MSDLKTVQVKTIRNLRKLKQYYVTLVAKTAHGWYQDRNFLILPEIIPGLLNSVVIPSTKWLKQIDPQLFLNVPVGDSKLNWINQFEINWNEIDIDSQSFDNRELSQKFISRITKVLQLYEKFFGFNVTQIDIQIMPVSFGTKTSFYQTRNSQNLKIFITIRDDIPDSFIIDGLISQLVIDKLGTVNENRVQTWKIREEIGEFILYHSKISKLVDLSQHQKTLDTLYSDKYQKLEYQKQSCQYLQELQLPLGEQSKLNWSQLSVALSTQELVIAKLLYDHRGQILNYDNLTQSLYNEKWVEKFNLQYLAKLIQEIRKKLHNQGIRNPIYTQRGVGYGWF